MEKTIIHIQMNVTMEIQLVEMVAVVHALLKQVTHALEGIQQQLILVLEFAEMEKY